MKSLLHSRIARWGVLVVLVAGVMVAAGATLRSSAKKGPNAGVLIGTVSRGPLTISVTESGTIKSRQQEVIKSEVEGTATILYLVPEGTRVKKGELLVELDVSKLQDQKVSQQIVVQNAEASAISARETLEVVKSQARSDIAKAELDDRFAKEDLDKYINGDYKTEKKKAESDIELAEAQLKQAEYKAEWSEKLFKEKYLSLTELEGDRLSLLSAKTKVDLAKRSLNLLEEFTYKRKLAELSAAVDQAAMALERVKRKTAAEIVQAEATLRAKESELARQKMILDKTLTMIERAKIYSPTDGLVVYATTGGGGGGFRGDREPLAEGQSVRERQELIYLPTANSAMAEIKVHESVLEKVKVGLPVRVAVDAVREKTFMGRVARIAPLPDAQSFWQNPDLKVFTTEIWLDGENSELRTGMTCRAEVVVAYYPDAMYVPVQSVVRVGGKPTAYVPGPDPNVLQPRELEVGMDNNSKIHVIKGLQAGEQIVLNPPLVEAAASKEEQGAGMPMPVAGAPNGAAPQTQPTRMAPVMDGSRQGPPGEGRRGMNNPGESDRPNMGEGRRPGQGPGNMTPEQMEQRRRQFENMSPEERQKMAEQMEQRRKQFESMSPEDRQKMMEQFRQRRPQQPRNPDGASGGNPQQ